MRKLKTERIFNDTGNHAGLRLLKGFKALYLRDFHSSEKEKALRLKKLQTMQMNSGYSKSFERYHQIGYRPSAVN